MGNSDIGGEGCEVLSESLAKMVKLTKLELNFNHNNIGKTGLNRLARVISHLTSLNKL